MNIKEKIVTLIPKKTESVKEIKVPDLKQYLVNGYEEIRQVKKENIELENQLEEEKKNKQLYEGALVTLSEFQQRDKDNKNEINRLKNKIKEKEQEINNINSQLNTYKIKQIEYDKREKNLKNEINENVKTKIDILKGNICNKIKNTKGNLSKDRMIDIIYKEAESI
jgi:chromosome segregation ATPase